MYNNPHPPPRFCCWFSTSQVPNVRRYAHRLIKHCIYHTGLAPISIPYLLSPSPPLSPSHPPLPSLPLSASSPHLTPSPIFPSPFLSQNTSPLYVSPSSLSPPSSNSLLTHRFVNTIQLGIPKSPPPHIPRGLSAPPHCQSLVEMVGKRYIEEDFICSFACRQSKLVFSAADFASDAWT